MHHFTTSRTHLRAKGIQDLHLTHGKDAENLWLVFKTSGPKGNNRSPESKQVINILYIVRKYIS